LLLSSTLRCRCRALWSSTRSLAFALLVLLVRKVLVLSRVVGNSKRVSRTSCRRSRDHGERKCDCVEHFHFIFPCLRIKKNRWRVSPPPVPFAQIPQLGSAAVVSVNSTHPCNFWISNPFGGSHPPFFLDKTSTACQVATGVARPQETFNTPCAIPSWLRTGSRIFGGGGNC
jgi:hypothetical protein